MKSHRAVGACFANTFFVLMVACSTNNNATTFENSPVTRVVDQKNIRTLDCLNPNEYRFVVVANPNRKKDSDFVIPKDLNIVVGDEVIFKINLPKVDSEVKNFKLNSVEKTETGFEMKADGGGDLYHYKIQFNFRCKGHNFYLYEVKKISFSTTNPDSGNFWDKEESQVSRIEPNLPIEKFVMTDYL